MFNDELKLAYSISDIARLTGKSCNLLYRRLTEDPKKYVIRFARREGERWVFDRKSVDAALAEGLSLIVRVGSPEVIDSATALSYIKGRFKSCGKEMPHGK
jgi:hypothetical protein